VSLNRLRVTERRLPLSVGALLETSEGLTSEAVASLSPVLLADEPYFLRLTSLAPGLRRCCSDSVADAGVSVVVVVDVVERRRTLLGLYNAPVGRRKFRAVVVTT
jgi:hypothetical protein